MRETRERAGRGRDAFGRALAAIAAAGIVGALGGCAGGPSTVRSADGRAWDPKLGVWSSPRLVADGDTVPRGGGAYLTGRPYVIGGRTYYPSQNPSGYSAVGTASWYGDAFHGRRTANGEVFDKGSISAAHPTLPLPSYVRVTNLKNGRSMVVRVNDRGPYHGGRVMDMSQRVADALQFRGEGTARVRVDYLGRAGLEGSDDGKLLATLRTDGTPAQLDGIPSSSPVMLANTRNESGGAVPGRAAQEPEPAFGGDREPSQTSFAHDRSVPLPPPRPFTLGAVDPAPVEGRRSGRANQLASIMSGAFAPLAFAETDARPRFPPLGGDRLPLGSVDVDQL